MSLNTCLEKLQYEVSFQTTAGLIDNTWFTVDVTARTLVLKHVATLTEDSVVLVNVKGYLTGENMPDATMEFTITVQPPTLFLPVVNNSTNTTIEVAVVDKTEVIS